MILFYIYMIFLFFYILIIFSITYGFIKTTYISKYNANYSTLVSIIISARNEQNNIVDCLHSIKNQSYDSKKIQLVIVDDNSTDNTYNLINDYITLYNLGKRFILIRNKVVSDNDNAFKKTAITEAIKLTTGDLIVSTDADCVMNKNWIKSIVDFYEKNNYDMILAPVIYIKERSFFTKIQSLEFLSLIASACGSLYFKKPLMCNGANLAYKRETFFKVDGFNGIDNFSSGDDVLLMFKISNATNSNIGFLKSKDSVVNTYPVETLNQFWQQRKRWVSKNRDFRDNYELFIAFSVYMFNLSIISSLIVSIFNIFYLKIFFLLLIVKIIVDFPVLYSICNFFDKKYLLKQYLPLQFIYVAYVSIIGIAGNIGKYKWKDRMQK